MKTKSNLKLFWVLWAMLGGLAGVNCTPSAENQRQISNNSSVQSHVLTGADILVSSRLAELKGKNVGIMANQTSLLRNGTHLVDTLLRAGIKVVRVFAPEHGFRGDFEGGVHLKDGKDSKTGLPIVALYGNQYKPKPETLAGLDVVLFDIQDVGTRFYTYCSSLSYLLEACAESKVPVWVLDRPNPNGWLVGGPVLEVTQRSFVGLHRIPILHGLTLGEYARMINAEGWLKDGVRCSLEVIRMQGYRHELRWHQTGLRWVPPSPNLRTPEAAQYYPILCWYEGTPVSVGRGTDSAFTVVGAPWYAGALKQYKVDSINQITTNLTLYGLHSQAIKFKPRSIPGRITDPPFKNELCYGLAIKRVPEHVDSLFMVGLGVLAALHQEYVNYYKNLSRQRVTEYPPFFWPFFDNLVGNASLKSQITTGIRPEMIIKSWSADLAAYKRLRDKYLLYE